MTSEEGEELDMGGARMMARGGEEGKGRARGTVEEREAPESRRGDQRRWRDVEQKGKLEEGECGRSEKAGRTRTRIDDGQQTCVSSVSEVPLGKLLRSWMWRSPAENPSRSEVERNPQKPPSRKRGGREEGELREGGDGDEEGHP
ncbi:hypothetical protein AMTR_s00074p00144580 [Amborella trichopoda]|uniref:Uncharacterized protein n=1 Tax=Amborella trichopoda TaxID=13333 RepID=W1NQ81_AMBTC|nr:hypothetical protein AMTR_s00074p00144580 [Amborella trichopoda]